MSEPMEITAEQRQEIIDELTRVREEFDRRVKESGRSPQMFVVTDRTGYAAQTLYGWDQVGQLIKEHQLDIDIEPLVPGTSITVHDVDEAS